MKEYTKEEIKELEKQRDKLKNQIEGYYENKRLELIKSRKNYIGKCYKHKKYDIYYKVLSPYSSNETRMTCLVVDFEDDIFEYGFKEKNIYYYDFPNIDVELNMFGIKDVFAFGIVEGFFESTNEITAEEFNKALEIKFNQFKSAIDEIGIEIEEMVEEYGAKRRERYE